MRLQALQVEFHRSPILAGKDALTCSPSRSLGVLGTVKTRTPLRLSKCAGRSSAIESHYGGTDKRPRSNEAVVAKASNAAIHSLVLISIELAESVVLQVRNAEGSVQLFWLASSCFLSLPSFALLGVPPCY